MAKESGNQSPSRTAGGRFHRGIEARLTSGLTSRATSNQRFQRAALYETRHDGASRSSNVQNNNCSTGSTGAVPGWHRPIPPAELADCVDGRWGPSRRCKPGALSGRAFTDRGKRRWASTCQGNWPMIRRVFSLFFRVGARGCFGGPPAASTWKKLRHHPREHFAKDRSEEPTSTR